jgi:hypothetical protein
MATSRAVLGIGFADRRVGLPLDDVAPGSVGIVVVPSHVARVGREPGGQVVFGPPGTGVVRLAPTLEPFLSGPVRHFLTWSDANAKAIAAGDDSLSVELDGQTWTQSVGGPQKYHAKSLKELRRKFAEVKEVEPLRDILAKAGCLEWLEA